MPENGLGKVRPNRAGGLIAFVSILTNNEWERDRPRYIHCKRNALSGWTDEEIGQLAATLTRLRNDLNQHRNTL